MEGIGSAVAAFLNMVLGLIQNGTNAASVKDTNRTNLRISEETNAANAEQANLAYQRSLPIRQLQDMIDAGISRPAAINKITGGGTYSAPVMQGATMQAPQMDLSSLQDAIGGLPSNVMQAQMQEMQMKDMQQKMRIAEQDAFNRNRETDQRIQLAAKKELRDAYGQEMVERTDNFMQKIVNLARQKGVSVGDLQSMEDLVKLGVTELDGWNELPKDAYDYIQQYVGTHANQSRAAEMHEKQLRSLDDKHRIDVKTANHLQQTIDDYDDEKNARKKEHRLREVVADLKTLATEYDYEIEKSSVSNLFKINEDGTISIKEADGNWHKLSSAEQLKRIADAKDFWSRVAEIAPINVLGRALTLILK